MENFWFYTSNGHYDYEIHETVLIVFNAELISGEDGVVLEE